MATQMIEWDDGVGFPARFSAPSASALVAGYVQIVSGSNYVITNSLGSGTKAPLGVLTQSAASGATSLEVRNRGYVWMTNKATEAIVAGQHIFPAGRGTITIAKKEDASGNAILGNAGFGISLKGATSGGLTLVQLARMS